MLLCLVYILASAQTEDNQAMPDTTAFSTPIKESITINSKPETDEFEEPEKIHLPRKATMYSAVLPGLGQIYNGQAWKAPFIYAGFAAFAYGIDWNNSYYLNYKKAYYHLNDNNPNTTFYNELLNMEIDEFNPPGTLNQSIMQKIEYYSRQRTLVIIGTAAFYLLNIVDANVNAHFLDFDISEDLTFNLQPMIEPTTGKPFIGAALTLNF